MFSRDTPWRVRTINIINMQKIYFDHSATTSVDERVLAKMLPYFSQNFGNASSVHSFGQETASAVDNARRQVAAAFGCEASEVIFTGGATEANNLALKGLVRAIKSRINFKPHVITTLIEHDAIIEPCRELVRDGLADVTYLPVQKNAVLDIAELEKNINSNTVLISVMFANSEVGAVQPIKAIGKLIKKINDSRADAWQKTPVGERGPKPALIYFHSDATQAVNFFDVNINNLNLDLVSMSAHKIYGPKGVGALIVRDGVPMQAVQTGGHHEKNLRSGTLNVAGVVGLGEAITLSVSEREANNKKIRETRDYLINKIKQNIPDIVCNTDIENSTPSHAHFSFLGAEGESILMALDMDAGIAVSTGSACASNTLKASRVLMAMDIKVEDTHGAIRFTLGKANTKADIDILMQHLPNIVKKFRDKAPAY